MSTHGLGVQVGLVLFAMAVISVIEGFVPLRSRFRSGARTRVNLTLTALMLGMNWLASALAVLAVAAVRMRRFGLFPWLGHPSGVELGAGIVLLDFFTYAAHLALHRVPFLW